MTDLRTRPVTLIPAPIGRRVGAYAIDVAVSSAIPVVLALVAIATVLAVGPGWETDGLAVVIVLAYLVIALASLAWTLVYTGMQGGRGSIGQRALGLRLADAATGAQIGFWRALLRNVVWGLAGSIVVGYLTPLFDSSGRGQGWHDLAAGAIVVDKRATDAAASVPPAPAPAPAANPYLPPPAVPGRAASARVASPVTGAAVAAPPAPPLPSASAAVRFAPGSPLTTQPPESVEGVTGLISSVPGVTSERAPREAAPPAPIAAPHVVPVAASPVAAAPAPAGPAAAVVPDAPAPAPAAPPLPDLGAASLPASAPAGDEGDLDATRAAASVAPVLAVLTWDDGTRLAVYGRTLVGRNPGAEEGAAAIPVRDETLSLSKTHFEVGGDTAGVWVLDRHSTNGTLLVRDGARQSLAPGERMPVRSGDRLEFGDRHLTVGGPA